MPLVVILSGLKDVFDWILPISVFMHNEFTKCCIIISIVNAVAEYPINIIDAIVIAATIVTDSVIFILIVDFHKIILT